MKTWASSPGAEQGSVLVIVLWVAFGLVSLALYFAQSMTMEYRASDQRTAAAAADQAVQGAARFVTNLLAQLAVPGRAPVPSSYPNEEVPIGDARFWILGRPDPADSGTRVVFGLTDEPSRLNLNTATVAMLVQLPRMDTNLASAIIDWRDTDSEALENGAEDEFYLRLNPPYRCKNGPFESVEELRLVAGITPEILYGEDPNQNGILDPNENDGDASPPADNQDGRLDPGLVEYLTIYSQEPTLRSDGTERIDVSGTNQTALATLLQEKFGADRANTILLAVRVTGPGAGGGGGGGGAGGGGGGGGTGGATNVVTYRSLLEFFQRSTMTTSEFAEVEADLTVGTNAVAGPVNVNTASEAVLACIPGIGPEKAGEVVSQRRSVTSPTDSSNPGMAWVTVALDSDAITQAGPYLTGQSHQFTADIAAVGPYGRGYRRVRYTVSAENGVPRFLARRDMTDFGWALGREVRTRLASQDRKR